MGLVLYNFIRLVITYAIHILQNLNSVPIHTKQCISIMHIYFVMYFKWKQYYNMWIVSVGILLYMACGAGYAPMVIIFIFLLVLISFTGGQQKNINAYLQGKSDISQTTHLTILHA